MLPPHQRLGSDDLAGPKVDFGLVVEQQLLAIEGPAQLILQAQSLHRLGVQRLAVELVAVASVLLGVGHRDAGIAASVSASSPSPGRAQFRCWTTRRDLARQAERLRYVGEDAPGDQRCVVDGVDLWKKQEELVTTHTGKRAVSPLHVRSPEQVADANGFLQPFRDCLQQRVPDAVSERLVDLLEAVEVDVEHGALASTSDPRAPARDPSAP